MALAIRVDELSNPGSFRSGGPRSTGKVGHDSVESPEGEAFSFSVFAAQGRAYLCSLFHTFTTKTLFRPDLYHIPKAGAFVDRCPPSLVLKLAELALPPLLNHLLFTSFHFFPTTK